MKNLLISATLMLLASNCSLGQPKINYGHDECAHCRMNVMDKKYACAITTVKGRNYVFDGPECMVPFVTKDAKVPEAEVKTWYVSDFAHPGTLMDATKAFFLHSTKFQSPMNGDVAAFFTDAERKAAEAEYPGEELDWAGAKKLLSE